MRSKRARQITKPAVKGRLVRKGVPKECRSAVLRWQEVGGLQLEGVVHRYGDKRREKLVTE